MSYSSYCFNSSSLRSRTALALSILNEPEVVAIVPNHFILDAAVHWKGMLGRIELSRLMIVYRVRSCFRRRLVDRSYTSIDIAIKVF